MLSAAFKNQGKQSGKKRFQVVTVEAADLYLAIENTANQTDRKDVVDCTSDCVA